MLVMGAMSAWLTALTSVFALMAAGGAAALAKSGICFVQEGELGAKKFCGRAVRHRFDRGRYRFGKKKGQLKCYRFGKKKGQLKTERKRGQIKIVYPGKCITIPGVLKLAKIDVRVAEMRLESHAFVLEDQSVYSCAAAATYVVREEEVALEMALFGTSDLQNVLHVAALTVRSRVLAGAKSTDMSGKEYAKLQRRLRTGLRRMAKPWGIEIISFELTTREPDAITNLRIQGPKVMAVNALALMEAAKELGLEHSKSSWPALAAALLPNSSALVATTAPSSHQELLEDLEPNGNGNGNGNGKPPSLSTLIVPRR